MALRLVLDTNVVLDIFHWQDARATPILAAARNGGAFLLTNTECLAELRHVLYRPQFRLTKQAADEIVDAYLANTAFLDGAAAPQPLFALPRCKDRDDQKFLELARDGSADLLVTRDKALLTLVRRKLVRRSMQIVRPEKAVAILDEAAVSR